MPPSPCKHKQRHRHSQHQRRDHEQQSPRGHPPPTTQSRHQLLGLHRHAQPAHGRGLRYFPRQQPPRSLPLFFFNDTATTEIYTLSLHDALPISEPVQRRHHRQQRQHYRQHRRPDLHHQP